MGRSDDIPMRRWCAVIQFPGKEPIRFGTTFVRHGAPSHEVEAAIRADIERHLPDGWALRHMVPGAIFFVPEEDT